MLDAIGNVWDWLDVGYDVVVPTSIGYRYDFRNVMGDSQVHLARYRDVDLWYGLYCYQTAPHSPVVKHPKLPLIFFPVRPINPDKPHLSFQQPMSLELIGKSATELAALPVNKVAVPLPATSDLSISDISGILRRKLDDRFVMVRSAIKKAA